MRTNIGTVDRVLRVILGLVLVVLYSVGWIGPWGLIGLVPLGTAILGYCPVYQVLGIHTCSRSQKLP